MKLILFSLLCFSPMLFAAQASPEIDSPAKPASSLATIAKPVAAHDSLASLPELRPSQIALARALAQDDDEDFIARIDQVVAENDRLFEQTKLHLDAALGKKASS